MAPKVTLPEWPPRAQPANPPTEKILDLAESVPPAPRPLTAEEREKMIQILDHLSVQYDMGLSRLARAVKSATDLKSVFAVRKTVLVSWAEKIAHAVGVSVSELWNITELPPDRQDQVKSHLAANDLIEPTLAFMVAKRRLRESEAAK